jgi:two-component system invasion response regulator UvrY
MIRILIADDQPVFREGLKYIFKSYPDIVMTQETGNGQEAPDILASNECDLVILDLAILGKMGFDILKEIKREHPKLPVLILSNHPEDQFAIRCLKAGSSGYLTKRSSPSEILEAVRKIHSGGKYISPHLAEEMAEYIETDSERSLHESLSDRELQVMLLLATGKTVTEVAGELSVSVKTISTHRAHILEKMRMRRNTELTQYAIDNGLLR